MVEKMVEKAMKTCHSAWFTALWCSPKKLQGFEYPFGSLFAGDIFSFNADAVGGQAKTCGGNAAELSGRVAVGYLIIFIR